MCINWPMIAGIGISALVWLALIKLAAYGYGLFAMRTYAGLR